jgi:dTDP-4-amino-4,6-dideoxygalactose transaminase
VNSRLDEIQAAILRALLPHLDARNARRAAIAAAYDATLPDTMAPARRPCARHVFHQYVVTTSARDLLRDHLAVAGIGSAIHYPMPVHMQPAYRERVALGPSGCRASEVAAAEVLSLPMYPDLTEAQTRQVCAALAALLQPARQPGAPATVAPVEPD